MKFGDGLMDVQIDDDDLRKLCEVAITGKLSRESKDMMLTICHHMVWDDLYDLLKNRLVAQ